MCCFVRFNRCFFLSGFNVDSWKTVALLLPRTVCSSPEYNHCGSCLAVLSHPNHWIALTQLLGILWYITAYCKVSNVYLHQQDFIPLTVIHDSVYVAESITFNCPRYDNYIMTIRNVVLSGGYYYPYFSLGPDFSSTDFIRKPSLWGTLFRVSSIPT